MRYDAVVIGGGHNGLTAAAYLARAGLDTVVLEARDQVGGCASTVEALGARVNVCMCDHVLIRGTPVIEELGLADLGLSYIDVDPHHLFIPWDGSPAWFAFTDLGRTLDSLALAYPDQVAGYRRLMEDAIPAARLLLDLAAVVPTPFEILKTAGRLRGRGARTLLSWSRLGAEQILRRYLSSPQVIGALLGNAPISWGLKPDHPGSGLAALSFAIRHLIPAGRPVGGSGALSESLARAVGEFGGTVRCNATVSQVVLSDRRVRGVRVNDDEITADIVVAAADPRLLYDVWTSSSVSASWARGEPPRGYESKLDAVVTALPSYRGLDPAAHGVSNPLVPTTLVSSDPLGLARAHAEMEAGRVSATPVLYANWPSVTDPSMVSPGKHLLGLEVLFTPYDVEGGWGSTAEPERWLAMYAGLLEPGFLDSVESWRVVTPVDYERDFGLVRGHVPSFGGSPWSVLVGRNRDLTRYRTPIDGLFLTGGGTFPGAGIWGASGRNAAAAILESLD